MRAFLLCFCLALSAVLCAPAQSSAAGPGDPKPLGFAYDLPAGWEVVQLQGAMPQAREKAAEGAKTEQEKKGLVCAELGPTAHSGGSIILNVSLPFDCFGQTLSDRDLPGFAAGATQGITQSFDIGEPKYGSYTLGTHALWIERVQGTPKAQGAAGQYTIEIACAVVKKAAVCWTAMATDDASMKAFEQGKVTLDGDAPVALVPATAFDKKPE